MVTGLTGHDGRMIFMIDFGMVRSYAIEGPDKKFTLRKARNKVLLRGTLRYCSLQVSPNIYDYYMIIRSMNAENKVVLMISGH